MTNFIQIIRNHEIESETFVLKPGDVWGGSTTTNISYFAPAYYNAYKTISGDTSWDNIITKSYDIIDANQEKTGAVHNLVSDWCKADGNFSTEVDWAKFEGKKYDYDASRTPWRIVLDYLWTGNTRALEYANKCIAFVNSKNGLNNIYPGYNLDGSTYETSYKDVTFTGAYAVAFMTSSNQTDVNNAYSKVVEMTTDAYFGNTLRVLYLLTLSGNFYNPEQFDSALSNNQINKDSNTISLYPNPVTDYIRLRFTDTNIHNVNIININGNLVYKKTYHNTSFVEIPVQKLAKGLYYIYTDNHISKFIKK